MDQTHLLPEPNEPVTEVEVRALIERFGERQTMAHGQPTVQDVAEALQVDPVTVGKMLYELRESKGQDEIKKRLDKLEKENAELRQRSGNMTALHTPFADDNVRRPFLFAFIAAIAIVAITRKAAFGAGQNVWEKEFIAILLVALALFLVGRRVIRRIRR